VFFTHYFGALFITKALSTHLPILLTLKTFKCNALFLNYFLFYCLVFLLVISIWLNYCFSYIAYQSKIHLSGVRSDTKARWRQSASLWIIANHTDVQL